MIHLHFIGYYRVIIIVIEIAGNLINSCPVTPVLKSGDMILDKVPYKTDH